MNTQTELALSPTAPQRDKHGRWSTCLPGIVLQIDERTRHEVPFAGPPDVDPGAGGCASEHRLAGHQAPPLGDWRRIHVISYFAGGEIRSYEIGAAGLLLAYPCHTGLWPEMDAEVARVVKAVAPC